MSTEPCAPHGTAHIGYRGRLARLRFDDRDLNSAVDGKVANALNIVEIERAWVRDQTFRRLSKATTAGAVGFFWLP